MTHADLTLPSDGRDLDPRLADATGIGAGQRPDTAGPDHPMPGAGGTEPWRPDPAELVVRQDTYYEQPVVKAPPWGGKVSAYVVAGGVAGAAATLAAAATIAGDPLRPLARVATPLAAASGALGAGLLVADLGRPERMLHMVRVVRPTSVMNVGGYVLSATTGAAVVATVLGQRRGLLGAIGRLAGLAAGVTGIPLAGYTGVLLGATALPGWNVGIRTLPPLFLASGAATSGNLLRLVPLPAAAQRTTAVFTASAQAAELAAGIAHDRAMRDRPHTRAAYTAQPGWRLGPWLTGTSLALSVLPTRRHPLGRLAGAALGIAGSILTKTAVFQAGIATATDPRATAETDH